MGKMTQGLHENVLNMNSRIPMKVDANDPYELPLNLERILQLQEHKYNTPMADYIQSEPMIVPEHFLVDDTKHNSNLNGQKSKHPLDSPVASVRIYQTYGAYGGRYSPPSLVALLHYIQKLKRSPQDLQLRCDECVSHVEQCDMTMFGCKRCLKNAVNCNYQWLDKGITAQRRP